MPDVAAPKLYIPRWVIEHPDEHLPGISARLQMQDPVPSPLPDDIDYVFILFSNRSGSTLLCELLASTGVMPLAQETLHVDTVLETARQIGSDRFDEVFSVLVKERARNGRFVAKASLGQICMLAGCGLLGRILPRTKFILIERMDKVAQVVSWSIANQTGQFTSYHDRTGSGALVYREATLRMDIEAQFAQEAATREFLTFNGIIPLHITYELLVAQPRIVGNLITAWVCGQERPVQPESVRLREQKTSTNREWADRFRASVSAAA
jgi:LPS sulfotransferase NodH